MYLILFMPTPFPKNSHIQPNLFSPCQYCVPPPTHICTHTYTHAHVHTHMHTHLFITLSPICVAYILMFVWLSSGPYS